MILAGENCRNFGGWGRNSTLLLLCSPQMSHLGTRHSTYFSTVACHVSNLSELQHDPGLLCVHHIINRIFIQPTEMKSKNLLL